MNQPTRHPLFPIESPDRLRQIWNQLPVTSKARLQQHLFFLIVNSVNVRRFFG